MRVRPLAPPCCCALLAAALLPVCECAEKLGGIVDVRELDADDCVSLAGPPRSPQVLEFCHQHNSRACCVPGGDDESHRMFAHLMDLGRACSYAQTVIYEDYAELRDWYCLACDPNEPLYRFRTVNGDPANNVPGVENSPYVWTWRVCLSFLERVWHSHADSSGALRTRGGRRYDRCGVKMENPCNGQKQAVWSKVRNATALSTRPVLYGWDPYQCGDSLIIPSKYYQGEWRGAATAFLRDIPPPNFDEAGFRFVVVDDSKDSAFSWADTPCFAAGCTAPAALLLAAAAGALCASA